MVLLPGIVLGAGAKLSAGVLPCLPLVVPMEAELGELRGDVARLLVLELDPNPVADNLREVEELRGLVLQQTKDLLGGERPPLAALPEINRRQRRRLRLGCRVLLSLMIGTAREPLPRGLLPG